MSILIGMIPISIVVGLGAGPAVIGKRLYP